MKGDGASSTGSPPRPERFLFLCALSLVAIYTLAPFEFAFNATELARRADEAVQFKVDERGWKLAGHVFAFAFAGGLAGFLVEFGKPAVGYRRLLWYGGLFCLLLEGLQLLQVSRHARLIDLIVNTGAWALGTWAMIRLRWARLSALGVSHLLHRNSLAFYALIAFVTASSWLVAGIYPLVQLRSLDWDRNFPLLIGNEEDGSEAWHGDIHFIRIYGTALSAENIRRLYKRHASALKQREGFASEFLVEYEFDSCTTSSTRLLPGGIMGGEQLIMDVPPGIAASPSGYGVRFAGASGLTSRGPASELSDALVKSAAFSIETLLRPLSEMQEGPARIVSLSSVPWGNRNFMLGQEGTDLTFRVRNDVNGENGLRHAASALRAIDASLQHIVAVYDHGVSMLYRNGRPIGQTKDVRDPALILGLGSAQASWAIQAILLAVFIALPVHFIAAHFSRTWLRHAAAVALTVGIGCLPYSLSPLIVGGPWRPGPLFWVTVALMTAYPWGLALMKPSMATPPISA